MADKDFTARLRAVEEAQEKQVAEFRFINKRISQLEIAFNALIRELDAVFSEAKGETENKEKKKIVTLN
jgi:hypothetical protein